MKARALVFAALLGLLAAASPETAQADSRNSRGRGRVVVRHSQPYRPYYRTYRPTYYRPARVYYSDPYPYYDPYYAPSYSYYDYAPGYYYPPRRAYRPYPYRPGRVGVYFSFGR